MILAKLNNPGGSSVAVVLSTIFFYMVEFLNRDSNLEKILLKPVVMSLRIPEDVSGLVTLKLLELVCGCVMSIFLVPTLVTWLLNKSLYLSTRSLPNITSLTFLSSDADIRLAGSGSNRLDRMSLKFSSTLML